MPPAPETRLSPETLNQNSSIFGNNLDAVPRRALTMGIGTILEAAEIILLATGTAKAEILARAVEGPITSMISASALQLHPACRIIVDEEAAENLKGTEYYRWIYENEPFWQKITKDMA